jgi:hypothetical protein
MSKRKAGLQKEFSAIFRDVWIPERERSLQPAARPAPPPQDAQQVREMEQIARRIRCSKDFQCYKSGFEKLCKAKIVGDGKMVECSPENEGSCEFRFSFAKKSFCKCPLRYYIAKNLKR